MPQNHENDQTEKQYLIKVSHFSWNRNHNNDFSGRVGQTFTIHGKVSSLSNSSDVLVFVSLRTSSNAKKKTNFGSRMPSPKKKNIIWFRKKWTEKSTNKMSLLKESAKSMCFGNLSFLQLFWFMIILVPILRICLSYATSSFTGKLRPFGPSAGTTQCPVPVPRCLASPIIANRLLIIALCFSNH